MSTKSIAHVQVRSVVLPTTTVGVLAGLVGGLVSILGSPQATVGSAAVLVGTTTVASCLGGVLLATVYNVVADRVGGIRFEVDDAGSRPAPPGSEIVDDDVVRCQECQGLEHRDRDSCRFCGNTLPRA